MGVENYKDLNLDAISPIKHIDAINVPVLLIHGRDDTVVPFDQSDVMLSAMKKAGKKVELVTLKKEDHWLSRSETRLQMLEALVAFVEANNPPN
jgi:dipeptidyl aminopeptidase/acylaminoacyl peptidase